MNRDPAGETRIAALSKDLKPVLLFDSRLAIPELMCFLPVFSVMALEPHSFAQLKSEYPDALPATGIRLRTEPDERGGTLHSVVRVLVETAERVLDFHPENNQAALLQDSDAVIESPKPFTSDHGADPDGYFVVHSARGSVNVPCLRRLRAAWGERDREFNFTLRLFQPYIDLIGTWHGFPSYELSTDELSAHVLHVAHRHCDRQGWVCDSVEFKELVMMASDTEGLMDVSSFKAFLPNATAPERIMEFCENEATDLLMLTRDRWV